MLGAILKGVGSVAKIAKIAKIAKSSKGLVKGLSKAKKLGKVIKGGKGKLLLKKMAGNGRFGKYSRLIDGLLSKDKGGIQGGLQDLVGDSLGINGDNQSGSNLQVQQQKEAKEVVEQNLENTITSSEAEHTTSNELLKEIKEIISRPDKTDISGSSDLNDKVALPESTSVDKSSNPAEVEKLGNIESLLKQVLNSSSRVENLSQKELEITQVIAKYRAKKSDLIKKESDEQLRERNEAGSETITPPSIVTNNTTEETESNRKLDQIEKEEKERTALEEEKSEQSIGLFGGLFSTIAGGLGMGGALTSLAGAIGGGTLSPLGRTIGGLFDSKNSDTKKAIEEDSVTGKVSKLSEKLQQKANELNTEAGSLGGSTDGLTEASSESSGGSSESSSSTSIQSDAGDNINPPDATADQSNPDQSGKTEEEKKGEEKPKLKKFRYSGTLGDLMNDSLDTTKSKISEVVDNPPSFDAGGETLSSVGGPSGPASPAQEKVAAQAVSFIPKGAKNGKLTYSQTGPRDPYLGSADCSSFVGKIYQKVANVNPGFNSLDQLTKNSGIMVDVGSVTKAGGGGGKSPDLNKLQVGDILFERRNSQVGARIYGVGHVTMYVGGGKAISMGQSPGPYLVNTQSDRFASNYIGAKRILKPDGSVYKKGDNIVSYQSSEGDVNLTSTINEEDRAEVIDSGLDSDFINNEVPEVTKRTKSDSTISTTESDKSSDSSKVVTMKPVVTKQVIPINRNNSKQIINVNIKSDDALAAELK